MHLHGINFKIAAYDGMPLPPEQQQHDSRQPVRVGRHRVRDRQRRNLDAPLSRAAPRHQRRCGARWAGGAGQSHRVS
ncbi:MAG: hypothetical protein IPM84_15785 [Anaerolineae bacterium]|nr:hypothetical protein [Anaerolineae bacterium]MBK9094200.1 hypothetical protein [Anaerolineae bacterium]